MTIKELIDELLKLDQNKKIKIITWDGCGGYEIENKLHINDYQKTKVEAFNNGKYSHEYYPVSNYTEDEEFYYLSSDNDMVKG